MSKCKLCQAGDPSVTVRCWDCQEVFHMHHSQYGQVPEGTVLMADCPKCGIVNCWRKAVPLGVTVSGPVFYYGQPIIDLREK